MFYALNKSEMTSIKTYIYILTTKSMFEVTIMLKRLTVKDQPLDNHELLNMRACSFNMFWDMGSTQSLVVGCGR